MTKQQSAELKGIAILFMFLLHLFNNLNGTYDTYLKIGNHSFTFYLSLYADICVAMFLFVSGYGLFHKYQRLGDKSAYLKSVAQGIKSLMINYWVILLLFVLVIGPLLGYTESHPGSVTKFLLNVFALDTSYNGAWWFLTTYILLALSSGIIFRFVSKANLWLVMMVTSAIYWVGYIQRMKVVIMTDIAQLDWFITELALYGNSLLPFVVGALFVKYNPVTKLKKAFANHFTPNTLKVVLALAIITAFTFKTYLPSLFFAGAFFAVTVIIYLLWNVTGCPAKLLQYFGSHSTNLWLTHMFIYMQFEPLKQLIYWTRDPVLQLGSLIIVCLLFSYPINWVKDRLLVRL